MKQMDALKIPRYRLDFITNPAFAEVLALLQEVERKEEIALRSVSRTGELSRINQQNGVVDGVERARLRLENWRDEILGPMAENEGEEKDAA
jgi:hypothetical protein